MENCLLAKDRGHFMTVLKMMVTNNEKFDDTFWKKVKGNLLKETSLGFSTGVSLKSFQENGLMETLSDLKESGQDEFSLKDLVPSYYYNKIYNKKQNIEIRLETKETHKTEIQKENNGENDWTPHNFAQTELVDELIVRDWGYDQTVVDKMCSDSPLMRGEFTFLGSRKTVKFSGSTSEPLMLYASYIDAPFDYKTYEKLAGAKKDNSVYVSGISENDITTEQMKGYLKRFVGNSVFTFTKKLRRKFNKRYTDNPGLKIKHKNHILIGVDTSGSVNTKELEHFMSEMVHVQKTGHQITVAQCDTGISDISPFNSKKDWQIKGRGGTDFQPVIDHFNEMRGRYTALIYLTDGEAPAPENCPKNTLWVLSADSNWTDHLPGKTIQLNTH